MPNLHPIRTKLTISLQTQIVLTISISTFILKEGPWKLTSLDGENLQGGYTCKLYLKGEIQQGGFACKLDFT